jgi:hypothetical protein
MVEDALSGAAASAIGTLALDVATYAEMVWRGRSSSGVPAQVAGKTAQAAGVDLAAGSSGKQQAQGRVQARQSGLSALLG